MKRIVPALAFTLLLSGRAPAIDLPELAERAKPAVVLLTVKNPAGNELSTGTGFFVSQDGRIVTNHHVVDGGAKITATLSDGSKREAIGILAADEDRDIAILKVPGDGLPALPLGDPSALRQGDKVAVIGSPLALSGTLTEGIVAAVRERGIGGENTLPTARAWGIQITASISPGSSGSPIMAQSTGEVVAVAVGTRRGGQSLNFGVSIDVAKELLAGLAPDAAPRPFQEVSSGSVSQNLLISAAVFGAMGLGYFLWSRIENRRRRPAPRLRR